MKVIASIIDNGAIYKITFGRGKADPSMEKIEEDFAAYIGVGFQVGEAFYIPSSLEKEVEEWLALYQ